MNDVRVDDILDRAGDFLTTGLVSENIPELQHLSIETYRALSEGVPATSRALAARTGLAEGTVASLLSAHPSSTIDHDDAGAIVAFNGLSLIPAAHRFEVNDRTLYTWCVFDALFLPQILGRAAKLFTRCPTTNKGIEVGIAPDRLEYAQPEEIVMSLVAPDRQACRDDLREAFCGRVSFFRNAQAFTFANDTHAEAICLNAAEAIQLALRRNALRYPDHSFDTF